jgi:uncharacterized protein (DUF488 family)
MFRELVYTIGHSNTGTVKFISLLKQYGIKTVVDVRSAPYSRHVPQFNKDRIKTELMKEEINYVFMGNVLGGKPEKFKGETSDDAKYRKISLQEEYKNGISRLIEIAKENKTSIMCSEENPENCHRHLLIAKSLLAKGVEVKHIRGSGMVEDAGKQAFQAGLFGQ